MITKFDTYNESVRDLMKPKSKEEILNKLGDLPPNELLNKSININYLYGVKLALKKGVNPSREDNYAIRSASYHGYTEIVKLLLQDERVDPSAHNNYAIRLASNNGHTEVVKLLLQNKRVDPSAHNNYAIRLASNNGHTEVIKLLLQNKRVDPSADDNYPIELASENGHTEVVKLLLQDKRVDPSDLDNYAIRYASKNGHLEIVRLLLQDKRVNPLADGNCAIQFASENGHTEVVKLLLQDKRVDPSADDNYAIQLASTNGHTEVVRLLLQDNRVDPSADDNYAIRYASLNGYLEIVKLLFQDERVREKLTDEEIKKYENQIKSLNESIRDLMKPKSKDEIREVTEDILDQVANYLLDMDEFDDYLDAYEKAEEHEQMIISMREDGDSIEKIGNRIMYGWDNESEDEFENYGDYKVENTDESVRDLMKPKSKEEIDELRKSGKFMGKVISDGYSLKKVINLIKKNSIKLNKSFKDDSEYRVVDWLYEWQATPKFSIDPFNIIYLKLFKNRNRYYIKFSDFSDHEFIAVFEYLEDALNFLKSCNIDTSKITKE